MSRTRLALTLRMRVMLVALLPLIFAAVFVALYFTQRGVNEMEQALVNQGQDSTRHLANAVAFDLFSGNLPPVKRFLDYERNAHSFEAAGVTDGVQWLLISGHAAALPMLTGLPPEPNWRTGPLIYFSQLIQLSAQGDPYLDLPETTRNDLFLVVSLSRAPVELTRAQLGLAAAGAAGVAILMALVLAWRLSGDVSRPLQAITHTVAQLADGNLTERTPEISHGEVGQLERGINRMAGALEENQLNLTMRIREATAELMGQKLAAEDAVSAKSRFLAAASHDLRQPLHALTLLVTALREQAPKGEAGRLARHIEASANAMGSLLNALLDLSKLDAGVVEVRPSCFPIQRVFTHVAEQFQPVAQARGIRLIFARSSLWSYSDPVLAGRILSNLVSNALRNTDVGGVLVGARRVGKHGIRIEVRDTGKGIPKEFQARIFEEYFQLDNPERHRDKGLGLGLAIVARLARLLGSQVQVRSEPGRGACFMFRLARCAAAPDQPEAAPPATALTLPLEKALVAFIDDDEAILAAMVEVFDHWNVALAAGEDAEQVRAELQALGRVPDLILCDYRLRGGHTGVEAVQLLREAFGADIPAALLTGDTATDTIQAIKASQLPVLHKPIKPAKLRAFLSHLLADSAGAMSSANRS
jgi:two-component system, sensor histidine kinase